MLEWMFWLLELSTFEVWTTAYLHVFLQVRDVGDHAIVYVNGSFEGDFHYSKLCRIELVWACEAFKW